jgi:hypothetical protein
MAVVQKKSSLFRTGDGPTLDPLVARGYPRRAIGRVENAASDSNGSRYHLIDLPSHVILLPGTLFHVENWGFAAIRLGTFDDVDALLAVLKSAATTQSPITGMIAAAGARLWQTLGLPADPGKTIGLYAHAIADATGAGAMPFAIEWLDNL